MKNKLFIFAILVLCSCTNSDDLDAVFPSYYLNGSSAKVWVQSVKSGANSKKITPIKANRKSIIFFSNHTYRVQSLIHLGSNYGAKGRYYIHVSDIGENVIDLYSGKEKQSYIVNMLSKKVLELENVKTKEKSWFTTLLPPTVKK